MQGKEIEFGDGKKRTLRYGVKQAGMIEHEFGDQPMAKLLSLGAGFRFVSYAVWAGLQTKKGGPSYEDVCDGMDAYLQKNGEPYTAYLGPIVEAMVEAKIVERLANGDDRPNEGTATDSSPTPSPSGGTTESPQSSATTG